jgi:hypothetical protein
MAMGGHWKRGEAAGAHRREGRPAQRKLGVAPVQNVARTVRNPARTRSVRQGVRWQSTVACGATINAPTRDEQGGTHDRSKNNAWQKDQG